MDFDIQPIWPLPWVLLVIAGLLALVLTTYPQRIRHLQAWTRRVLLGLRLAAVALLAIAMLRPAVNIHNTDDDGKKRILYVLADASRSMAEPDAGGPTGGKTRRQALLETLHDAREAFAALPESVEVRFFDFAEDLGKPVDRLTDKTDGRETNPAAALHKLQNLSAGKRVLGVILMGDCAPRVSNLQSDPRQEAILAARNLGDRGIPVHTVPFGKTGWMGSVGDLSVVEVAVDPNPYQGKVVSVHVTLRAVRAKGRRLTAKIRTEDQTIPGTHGDWVDVPPIKTSRPVDDNIVPDDHEDVIKRELTFVPTRPGKQKIAVEFSGLPDEKNLANNILTRIINVRSGGISVAYFDRLRTEQKFLRRVNASDKIQLDYFPVRTGGRGENAGIDPKIFHGGDNAYDVFIIGDVPAAVFGGENLKRLRERIDDGAGFLMIGGYHSFGAGGWAGTPIARVLPVQLNALAAGFTEEEKRTSDLLHYNRPLRMVPTARGLLRIVMRIAPDSRHAELWKQLDPLEGANRLQVKENPRAGGENLIEVLATTDDGNPLLVFHEWAAKTGKDNRRRLARVMAFGADTTFQWYLGGHQQAHQRFWRQMILFLAQKDEEEQPVWVRIDRGGKRHFQAGDVIPVRFGARDKDGKAVDGLNYEIQVLRSISRKEFQTGGLPPPELLVRTNNSSAPWELRLDNRPLPAGEYWIKVIGQRPSGIKGTGNNQPAIYGVGWERFVVEGESIDPELENRAADPALLEIIAGQTGGTFVSRPDQFKEFLRRLAVPRGELLGRKKVTLWDTWPPLGDGTHFLPGLLLLFVALMSVEWFLRKRKGLV